MGKYDLIIKNITTGKTYEYPVMLIEANSIYRTQGDYWEIQGDILGGSIKQLSDAVPLFSFLEMTENVGDSYVLEINNQQITGSIKKPNINCSWVEFDSGNATLFYSPPNHLTSNIWDNNYRSIIGTCLVYNYKDEHYYTVGGGTNFSPENNSSSTPSKIYYNNEYYKGGTLVIKSTDIKKGGLYQSPFPNSPANYYMAQWGTSNTGIARILNNMLNPPKPPKYPNQNPDGDNDGTGQTPSDSPIPGDGDTSSDPIPNPPAKPTFNVTNTGFVVIYNPSVTEIRQLAYFMWSGEFVDLIKKMFASPFEAIISLKMLFCPITAGSSQTVWLGNVETDVTMAKVTDQFTDVDLGTINVNEFFGSFADYAPFTKIQIYLPFIGFKDLNVDEIMNSQLHLRYRVDVYTGACIAYLTVTKTIKSTNLNSILYQFDGNCAMEIPFTSNDNSRYVAAIMNSVASSALSLANTSGYTMPVTGKGFNQKAITSTFELGSLAPVANGMLDIMSAKPNVQRAGSLSGAVSAMALKQPYLIIHRPIAQMPADYQKYLGIPLNLTRQLANITGYTIVSQVFMSSELATDKEIAMITEALKNGVIL